MKKWINDEYLSILKAVSLAFAAALQPLIKQKNPDADASGFF
ncbi:MAG: hypothetical protein ACI3VD_08790 [Candidatus Limivicinus sp.]